MSAASDALRALLDRADGSYDAGYLYDLTTMAQLDQPVVVDADTAAAAVRPYEWLLYRVGTDGIGLTAAGYLPPTVVRETMTMLEPNEQWVGKNNRESLTAPVLHLRESAQRMGLVRKYRGRLVRTPAGTRLAHDPIALWWHLASRLPDGRDDWEHDAGVMLLLAVAVGMPLDWRSEISTIHRGLLVAGWRFSTQDLLGGGLTTWEAARPTWRVLRQLGALATSPDTIDGPPLPPPASGIAFARAALRQPPG